MVHCLDVTFVRRKFDANHITSVSLRGIINKYFTVLKPIAYLLHSNVRFDRDLIKIFLPVMGY